MVSDETILWLFINMPLIDGFFL